jgi:hypothetical protein
MPSFQILLTLDDNAWRAEPCVPNGTTVQHTDVVRVLALAMEHYSRNPSQRLLTIAEVASIEEERRLPPGWKATADGVNVYSGGDVTTYMRRYQRGEDAIEAPCDASGYPTRDTRLALVRYDIDRTPEA